MRSRLSAEHGMVMPIAVVVLSLTLLLGGAAVLAATQSNDLSQRDSNGKAALEAAEAGLRAATYRLNMFLPVAGRCPTNPSTTVGGSGLCAQDGPESLGNGSTFSYWVSDVLTNGQQCAGVPVTAPNSNLNPQYVAQRCITAVGTANTGATNAVSARVQARVASYAAQALFSVPGIVGLNELSVANNAVINAAGGTNGLATVRNNATLSGLVLGPNGSKSVSNGASTGQVTQLSAAQGPIGLPLPSFGNSASVNNDSRIGAANSTTITCQSSPPVGSNLDTCQNKAMSWSDTSAHPRELSLGNKDSITLGGSVYNFCNFTTKNNATINVPTGTYTTIYIDSPADPNSAGDTGTKCAAGTGNLTLGNGITINVYTQDPLNPGHADPTALKFFVYGDPTNLGSNVVTWNNNGETDATLVAPFSSVELQNNGAFNGAAGGYNMDVLNNFTFTWYSKESSLYTGQQDLFYRTAWEQCSALGFNASTPTVGC